MQAVLRSLNMQRVQTAHTQRVDHFRSQTAKSREFEQQIGMCMPYPWYARGVHGVHMEWQCVRMVGTYPYTKAKRNRQPGCVATQAYGPGWGAGGEHTAPGASLLR